MKSTYVVSFSIACLVGVRAVKTQIKSQASANQEWWMTSPTTTTETETTSTTSDPWWLMSSSVIEPTTSAEETSAIEEQIGSSLDFGSQDPLTQ